MINVKMELKSGNLLGKELNRLKLPGNESKAVNYSLLSTLFCEFQSNWLKKK